MNQSLPGPLDTPVDTRVLSKIKKNYGLPHRHHFSVDYIVLIQFLPKLPLTLISFVTIDKQIFFDFFYTKL